MSAFMVEDKCINRVVCRLIDMDRQTQSLTEVLAKATGIAESDPDFWPKLGAAMFQLNVDAVNARYGENQAETFRDLDYDFRFEPWTPMQALKSLQCWLYQCAEGDVPDRPLYKAMSEIGGTMSYMIVSSLPEYEQCAWG